MKININHISDCHANGTELKKIINMDKESLTEITLDDVTYSCADKGWTELYKELNEVHKVLKSTLKQFTKEELLGIMSFTIVDNNLTSILKGIDSIDENNVLDVIVNHTEDYDKNHDYFIIAGESINAFKAWTCDDWMSFVGFSEFMSYIWYNDDIKTGKLLNITDNIVQKCQNVLSNNNNKLIKDMSIDEHMNLTSIIIEMNKQNISFENFEETIKELLNEDEWLKVLENNHIRPCTYENIKFAVATYGSNGYISIDSDHSWMYKAVSDHTLDELYDFYGDEIAPGVARDIMKTIGECYSDRKLDDQIKELVDITKPFMNQTKPE